MMRTAVLTILFSLTGAITAGAAYCPGQAVDPYSYLCTATSTYAKGQPITFTLFQSRVPLVIGPLEHPWKIIDERGNLVYAPSSTPPTTWPGTTFEWSDAWNQTNASGKQVHKGTYTIVFPNMPYNIMSLTITVTNKLRGKDVKNKGEAYQTQD